MNTWCHLPTSFRRRYVLHFVALALIAVALTTTLLFAHAAHATTGTNRTINFQGRLLNKTGAVVADGHYNMQFKIYQDGSGAAVGNPDGTLKWTESYVNNGSDGGIDVKNGYFSVSLGSVNPFGTSVDWNQATLWLSMNVAGNAATCTTFGTSPCGADGEMLPMKQITATPYALNSGAVGGKTADNLVQLGQGKQTDTSLDTSSIFINKTGSGNLIQLQNTGSDVFTVADNGDLVLGSNGAKAISISQAAADSAGQALTIAAGAGGDGTGTTGGELLLQGGAGGGSDSNGGNIILSGGAGVGSGASGLVILGTPTFSTVTSDANCYTNGAIVTGSCTIAQSSVDSSSSILTGFSVDHQTATLPDPTITTAGRILYVIAASDSHAFTLDIGGGHTITMQPSTATALIWSGTGWAAVNGSGASSHQSTSGTPSKDTSNSELALSGNSSSDSLTINGNAASPSGTPLDTSSVPNDSDLSLGGTTGETAELASDGGVADSANFTTNWSAVGNAAVTRITSDGQAGDNSVQISASSKAGDGIRNKLDQSPSTGTNYRVSVYAKLLSGSDFTDMTIQYSPDGGASFTNCTSYTSQTVTTNGWTQITCTLTTPVSAATNPYIYLLQPTDAAHARTFLIDTLSVTSVPSIAPSTPPHSSNGDTASPTKAAPAPSASDSDALLGSMYYDTTLGKLQCYQADGWGNCGDTPDTFVTISPEYTNAVMNGTDVGTITSDLCSDTLNINDGSSGQPTICGPNETYNFYQWTSAEKTTQTRSIYVTYQLPANFKKFTPGSTSLLGRTDSSDAAVSYQIYRDDTNAGLVSCGAAISVSSGAQSTWQKVTATGDADLAQCGFEAGNSILFRINLTAKNNANAYVSSLNFIFSNN